MEQVTCQFSEAEDTRLLELMKEGATTAEMCLALHRSNHAIHRRVRKLRNRLELEAAYAMAKAAQPEKPVTPLMGAGEKFEEQQDDKQWTLDCISRSSRSVEDILEERKVDTAVWGVDKLVTSTKVYYGEPLKQIKITLRRLVPKIATDALAGLMSRVEEVAPVGRHIEEARPLDKPHLMYLGLHDVHIGKLSWQAEVDDSYDLSIAARLYQAAGVDLVAKASGFAIEKFVIPVGHDLIHINGNSGTTAGGTPMDVDGRLAKIYETALTSVIRLIDYLATKAPVEVIFVSGNHDRDSSYFLCRTLAAWFRNSGRVTVDVSPNPRKYISYGVNLIGCVHGDAIKETSLAGIMAAERPNEWATSHCREWLVGHTHKPRSITITTGDMVNGVEVRTLPSLSAADRWHHEHGFVAFGSGRTCQALLYSRDDGFVAQFSTGNSILENS